MIPLKDQELIRQKFAAELLGPVKIDYFTERELSLEVPGRRPCAYCKPVRELLRELAALSELISLRVHIFEEAADERTKFGVERIPGIVLRGAQQACAPTVAFKYYGMPGGTEFPAFLESIVDISRGDVLLSKESVKELRKVREVVVVRVFVTPTCGYCPQMVRAAYQLSLANAKVQAEVVEVNEFPELADRYQVKVVPLTVILRPGSGQVADKVAIPGAMHPDALVEQVVQASGAGVSERPAAAGPTSEVAAEEAPRAPQRGEQRPSGLIIP